MGHDWILLVRKVVYDPNNITHALCLKKNSIPIRIDYTEVLHSCFAKCTAVHYKMEDCRTFKDSVSCFLLRCCALY